MRRHVSCERKLQEFSLWFVCVGVPARRTGRAGSCSNPAAVDRSLPCHGSTLSQLTDVSLLSAYEAPGMPVYPVRDFVNSYFLFVLAQAEPRTSTPLSRRSDGDIDGGLLLNTGPIFVGISTWYSGYLVYTSGNRICVTLGMIRTRKKLRTCLVLAFSSSRVPSVANHHMMSYPANKIFEVRVLSTRYQVLRKRGGGVGGVYSCHARP